MDRLHEWRLAARLGYDLVDGTSGNPLETAGTIRRSHVERAQALAELPPDMQALRARRMAERAEARKDRKARRANRVTSDDEGVTPRNDRLMADPEVTVVMRNG